MRISKKQLRDQSGSGVAFIGKKEKEERKRRKKKKKEKEERNTQWFCFRRLSSLTARRVPMLWKICTMTISRITASSMTRYL